uniref:Uncharacterized protein n=1 Tax=Anopheles culicifacies TaxID=139723 RepID=A0A182M1W6_9DIPT
MDKNFLEFTYKLACDAVDDEPIGFIGFPNISQSLCRLSPGIYRQPGWPEYGYVNDPSLARFQDHCDEIRSPCTHRRAVVVIWWTPSWWQSREPIRCCRSIGPGGGIAGVRFGHRFTGCQSERKIVSNTAPCKKGPGGHCQPPILLPCCTGYGV